MKKSKQNQKQTRRKSDTKSDAKQLTNIDKANILWYKVVQYGTLMWLIALIFAVLMMGTMYFKLLQM